MISNYLFWVAGIFLISSAQASSWFEFDSRTERYSIVSEAVNPSSLFRKISQHSGIEIKYSKSIVKPIYLKIENADLNSMIRVIDQEFSTFKRFESTGQGESLLVAMTVLPKGMLDGSDLVLAGGSKDENIFNGAESDNKNLDKDVYRQGKLNEKIASHLEKLSEKRKNIEFENSGGNKSKLAESKLAELNRLKETDRMLYEHKLKIYSRGKNNFEESALGVE